MSAGGTVVGGASQLYFCYQCNRTVAVTPSPNAELLCPSCNGGFLEEYDEPDSDSNPNPNLYPNLDPFSDPLSGFLSGLPLLSSPSSSSLDLQNPRNFSAMFGSFGSTQTRSFDHETDQFDPFIFLQNYLASMRSGGANIQFVIDNQSGDPGFRVPGNIGDYFMGPGLEQLIQQLAENDPNRYGTPPASKSAIDALPSVVVDEQLMNSGLAQCAVCKDDFEKGMEVKEMPCKHIYHSDCILPWLELHNSCPVCRHELPTDDPDYENKNRGTTGSGNSSAGSGSGGGGGGGGDDGNSAGERAVERRFRISLPWPLGALGFPAETSEGGGSNSGGQGNRDSGSGRQDSD